MIRRLFRLVKILAALSSDNPKLKLGDVSILFDENLKIDVPGEVEVNYNLLFLKCDEQSKDKARKDYQQHLKDLKDIDNPPTFRYDRDPEIFL